MSRIANRFEWLKSKNEKALVAFFTAGDPDLPTTKEIFSVVEENGADIIELGVPFSDPLADGPVIQAASNRALKSGTTLKKIIALVRDIRQSSQLPIVLMTSYNPVFVYGQEKFVDDAVAAGVDGVIVPDLPPEEAEEFHAYADGKGLDMIYLLAPTSTEDRVARIAEQSRGFIYFISITGVTGMQASLTETLGAKLEPVRKIARIPVLIGFGINNADSARAACRISDGVIVGSAIVRLIEQNTDPGLRKARVGELVREIKQAILGGK